MYSSGTPVLVFTTMHTIGALGGARDRRLYRGAATLSGFSMIGVGAVTWSSASVGMRCGAVGTPLLGVTLVYPTW